MSVAPAPTEPSIRRAEPVDLAAMLELEAAAFPQPWTHDQLASELRQSVSMGLVAEQAGVAVGYALFRHVVDEVELLRLAVHVSQRRRGVASRLVAEGFDLLRMPASTHPAPTVAFLEVREDNLDAIRFYEGTGWRAAGRRRHYYPDGTDALLYRREI